jgi:tetratricopeptide (TPR) repeat protein
MLHQALELLQRGEPESALNLVELVLTKRPRGGKAHILHGMALAHLDRREDALAAFGRAIDCAPDDFEAHANRARLLAAMKRYEQALAGFAEAQFLRPQSADPPFQQGLLLAQMGRREAAIAAYDAALRANPRHFSAANNRGNLLKELGRLDEAFAAYNQAALANPNYSAIRSNRAIVQHWLGRYREARADYETAIKLDPNNLVARFDLGNLLLLQGEFGPGWEGYEYRWSALSLIPFERVLGLPLWAGERLEKKTILLLAEQGLGDTIQFMRYAPLVAERGGRVVVAVRPPLVALTRGLAGVDSVCSTEDPAPKADFCCPLMSLPRIFRTVPATIPAQVPYLAADPERVAHWRAQLGQGGRKIGICWQGNPNNPIDRKRSAGLRAFAELAAIPGVRLISLQKDFRQEQIASMSGGLPIETLGDDFDSGPDGFLDTAAVMMALDLVISVDTSIAHLAGALARPVWVALPYVPDWRWLLEREDSPWYPTMRLFRQSRAGDWGAPFARIAEALRQS